MALSPGTRLGSYEITAPLGAGGMGEVYRARDTKLRRDVALKVLPKELSADREALARFEREARAAASLSHPNVLGIHDFDTHGGIAYAVLELLEGETLRQWLADCPLPPRKTVDYLTQVARGLAAAHEKGIVHRDLKPENIFVTRDGCVKILDFGLAKLRASGGSGSDVATAAKTEPGTILGTVGYMSPEQVRGLEADARSDIFSFGVILYEAVSGRRAFRGDSPIETMNAILRDDPPELPESLRAPAGPLERIARRCMEKRPDDRFQSARDLGFALEAYSGAVAAPPLTRAPSPSSAGRRSIAVLPFKDLSRDPESAHLGVGLADATITELALVRSLLVRPTSAILNYRDRTVSSQQAGQELGTDAVLDASFQRFGSRLRVTVQLVRTEDGQPLWGSKIDTSLDDLFEMQDRVSRKIAEALQVELTPSDERRLGRGAQPAAGAYELYLKGRVYLLQDTLPNLNAAIEAFEKARAVDPGSALPLVGLADAYARMAFTYEPDGEWYEKAVATCEQALAVEPNLPEGRYLRGRLLWTPQRGFDFAGVIREVSAAIAARPSLNEAHGFAGIVLLHASALEESEAEFRHALLISPEDSFAERHLGLCYLEKGEWAKALELTLAASRSGVQMTWLHYQLAHAQLRAGDRATAVRTIDAASRLFVREVLFFPVRAIFAALDGNASEAHRQIDLTVQNRRAFGHYHHAQYDVACAYALLGERDRALEWLTGAAGNGYPCYSFFEVDPLLSPLRSDPRFGALMNRLKTECDGYRELWHRLRDQQSDPSVAR